jgi:transposase
MTYSIDFRRKVLSIKEREQLSFEAIAQRVEVGKASVFRWSKASEVRRTGHKPATQIDREKLKQDVEPYPDAYQYERAPRLRVSQRGIGYALKRLRISRKKPCSHPQADIVARNHFQEQIEAYQSTSQEIVYLEESGFAHDMPRRFGYAPRGIRCIIGMPKVVSMSLVPG